MNQGTKISLQQNGDIIIFDIQSDVCAGLTRPEEILNVAARIGAQATGGSIYLSRTTADRIKGHFSPVPRGKFKLKNVSQEVEFFKL